MVDSVAKRLVLEISSRCQQITVANGFHTNAGQQVFRGRVTFDAEADPLPALSIFAHEEVIEQNMHDERMDVKLNIAIFAHAETDALNPLDIAEDLVADIKRAVLLLSNRSAGGLCQDIRYAGREAAPPEDGSNTTSVRVHFEVLYPEIYGDPHTVI